MTDCNHERGGWKGTSENDVRHLLPQAEETKSISERCWIHLLLGFAVLTPKKIFVCLTRGVFLAVV